MDNFLAVSFAFLCIAASFTHILVCVATNAWGLLFAGLLFFPVSVIHGFLVWFF